jgi:hypothetical protein
MGVKLGTKISEYISKDNDNKAERKIYGPKVAPVTGNWQA